MSVKDRLNEYLKSKNIRKSHFEKSINVSNGYINSLSGSHKSDKTTTSHFYAQKNRQTRGGRKNISFF